MKMTERAQAGMVIRSDAFAWVRKSRDRQNKAFSVAKKANRNDRDVIKKDALAKAQWLVIEAEKESCGSGSYGIPGGDHELWCWRVTAIQLEKDASYNPQGIQITFSQGGNVSESYYTLKQVNVVGKRKVTIKKTETVTYDGTPKAHKAATTEMTVAAIGQRIIGDL